MDNYKIINSKKYIWDGENYESESAAKENLLKYSNDGFETELIVEEGKYLIYTRRVATEILVDGEPK